MASLCCVCSSRPCWYDSARGQYSTYCGNTCRFSAASRQPSSAPTDFHRSTPVSAPTAPSVSAAPVCSVCSSRPCWYDSARGQYSTYCGNTCRFSVSSGSTPTANFSPTAFVPAPTASGVCIVCHQNPRWFDSRTNSLSLYCSRTCLSHGRTQTGVSSAPSSAPHSTKGLTVKLFHGTSSSAAQSILRTGFQPSSTGQLGAGIYFAREEKAEKFANDAANRGKGSGAVVFKCLVTAHNPKFIRNSTQAGDWRSQGYDAVRCDDTQRSTNMEWCVASSSQVKIVAWRNSFDKNWNQV